MDENPFWWSNTHVQPELRRLFGQPRAASTVRIKRASVDSTEHNRWCGGEDLRCNRAGTENTRLYNCMQLFSSFLLQLALGVSRSPHGGWLHCKPWKKLLRFSLLLLGLIFTTRAALTTTAHQAHYYYPHGIRSSSGVGGCVCPNDVPATTCIHLPAAILQLPGSLWGHFNSQFLEGTDIIADNTPEIFSPHYV